MNGAEVAAEVHVTGSVQGVAYRWTCQVEAERRGVRGWVRNEPDGSVAAWFEGDVGPVHALVDWCRSGPSGARVDGVDVRPAQVTGLTGFEVRY